VEAKSALIEARAI
jgi:tetratricopeptide repeat protein 21B